MNYANPNLKTVKWTATPDKTSIFLLDIGGEGRHAEAWNLNPSAVKTRGPDVGARIPRLILGRAQAIPLPDNSVDIIIVERTPLRMAALREIQRVIHEQGTIILRHALPPNIDPHRLARDLIPGHAEQRKIQISGQWLQETTFECKGRRDA